MSVSKHEERDININAVVLFASSLVVAGIIVHFVVVGMFRHFAARRAFPTESRREFTGPRLVVNQAQDMEKLRASEDASLNSYGWVDREQGIVRIPIDRAIELLSETDRGSKP